ncbi:MAG: shikimate dehydrogenase [Methanomassiliicoccales archaeon]|jgi:shikimate dehydrogenase/3-dehydroquinate dehydratase type I
MRICVSIIEPSLGAALSAAKRAKELGADLIEVRFDMMPSPPSDLTGFDGIGIEMIATLRPAVHGGGYVGNEQTRRAFLRMATEHGFGLIDLEDGSVLLREARKVFPHSRIIASHHDHQSTPSVNEIVETLSRESGSADVAKAAYKVNSISDLLTLADATRALPKMKAAHVLIGMGAAGEITRVCADRLGSVFSYACLEKGKEAAPGQLDLTTMMRLGRGGGTIVGVVGGSLGHSRSAAMHNAAFDALGLPGHYFKFETKKDELDKLKPIALAYSLRGFNVTIPYKELITPLLDSLDEVAQSVKAVNTVVVEDGLLRGTNTDAFGIQKTIELAGVDARGKNALLIGAGGAARACAWALKEIGAKITITNRTAGKAKRLAEEFEGETVPLKDAPNGEYEMVINCTPLGMVGFPDKLPIAPAVFREGQFVMDVVYNPPRTKFLVEAEKKGAVTRNGEDMLVFQAAKAFELWTGGWPPTDVMKDALRRSLS